MAANLVMVMAIMRGMRPREQVGSARSDGARQLSGKRKKGSGPGDEVVVDKCKMTNFFSSLSRCTGGGSNSDRWGSSRPDR
jgi:hypothetical protein